MIGHSGLNTANSSMPQTSGFRHCTDVECISLATVNMIIMVLGIIGNGLVIWITGFKIKKTVNTVWYLSLAMSDFLFCAFLPLSIVYIVKSDWIFGSFMCKFLPFFLFLNWFSSILLLIIISIDRYVLVKFPVWVQNKRTIRKAWVLVLLAWIISPLLSFPLAIFYDIKKINSNRYCISYNHGKRTAVQTCLFIFGFVIPFLIIIICYLLIIRKLKKDHIAKSNKSVKIMTALIAAFFISWMPYHFINLLDLNPNYAGFTHTGRKIGITLAGANSFMNPLLYAFMGRVFRRKMSSSRSS
ncbi:C3a anaphylatoxin chemotactic receptor-like [Clarias gariepinus]|uniref:C3a anaphylatoxin chemotactic receptor-like n=1 Tax=Clarias gariepinus TaxID=13013 RepID=UPI00234E1FAC|nr:C3a anaphylatoxin chemotactic receptor-like [Clarias gariepinus]